MKTRQNTPVHDVLTFANELIAELVADGRYGTSKTYSKTAVSFKAFLSTDPARSVAVPIEDMDDILICHYNRYLSLEKHL